MTEIIRKYETAYRDLVTFRNWSDSKNVEETLRLNKEQDWSFICTALDVIGDTTLAIQNFLEYKLEGPNGTDSYGEKYLRLYGILNSTYLQQEAIYSLYKFNNVPDPKKVSERIKQLKIFEIRNKIGAHSSDYIANKGKDSAKDVVESYIPIRPTLHGYYFEYLNNEKSTDPVSVDLKECISEHLILIIDLLDKIYEKAIKTIYRGNQLKLDEELNKLTELRRLKNKILSES